MSTGKRRGRAGARVAGASARGGPEGDRALRQKNNDRRHAYLDGLDSDSDEEVLKQTFNVLEKLACPRFAQYFVKELLGEELQLSYFQRSGFATPILVKRKAGLGMTMPEADSFTVTDVKNAVGARRVLDVMDCTTQRNSEITMKDFEEYFNNPNRDARKLNVISLEFSFTKLEPFVIAPKVVRQIDWTDNVWPRHLKEQQTEGTNDLREMKYPKVQKYCLMSVAGCYTDFHIDFGGTSVWYHIVKGKKVFWIIPPTETNLKIYEQWTLSGKQSNVFFGDLVEKCGKVILETGNTFFIPSGWIHAVYTPEDSLVFGGNFLHSFAIEKQIRVAQIEEITKVPQKFRFPFFTELQWYALDKYCYHLVGRTHLDFDPDVKTRLLGSKEERQQFKKNLQHIHLTPHEIFGMKAIVMYLHALAVSKKNVPVLLDQPVNLIRDIRVIVNEHKNDDPQLSISGKPVFFWPGIKYDPGYSRIKPVVKPNSRKEKTKDVFIIKKEKGKKDRVPCKICQACISPDCGMCNYCSDMPRFGGPGRMRHPCQMRQCLQPLLINSVVCNICGLDGWYAETNMRLIDRPAGTCALMECNLCNEVTHPTCVTDVGVEGYIKMELPNSWECPKCVKAGLATKLEPKIEDPNLPSPAKLLKTESGEAAPIKKPMAYGADTNFSGYQLFSVQGRSDQPKHELRQKLADQIISASIHPHKDPPFVVRPPPLQISAEEIYTRRQEGGQHVDLKLERGIMLKVFQKLTTVDLSQCASVCRDWNKIIQDPSLWSVVKLSQMKITSHLLSLIVQRQPTSLILDWSIVGKQHLTWLLPRIPQTKIMSLRGLEYSSSIIALNTVNCPMLQELDLSFVTNFNDMALYKLLSAPKDSRPGLLDKKSRQKLLTKLTLDGTEISDVGLRYVTQFLSHLQELRVANCWKITDAGLAQLSMSDAKTAENLRTLDISHSKSISNVGLQHLSRCQNLTKIYCTGTCITSEGMKKFIEQSSEKLKVTGGSLIEPKSGRRSH